MDNGTLIIIIIVKYHNYDYDFTNLKFHVVRSDVHISMYLQQYKP